MIQDVVEKVINVLRYSKADILSTARVARCWVPRSRHHLAAHHWSSLDLKSFEDLLGLIRLLHSPNCTFTKLSKVFEHLSIESSPAFVGPLTPDSTTLLGEGIVPFLRNTTISSSLKINLDRVFLQPMEASPFPWALISHWKGLSHMSLTAVLPSLATLTSLLLELRSLQTVELDVDYLNNSIPQPVAHFPPSVLRSLSVGPRGYSVFSWLAILPRNSFRFATMSLTVWDEDFSPFLTFAGSGTNEGLGSLEVSLRRDVITELGACLPAFTHLAEMTVSLQFCPAAVGWPSINAIIDGLNNECLEHLQFIIPSSLAIPWPIGVPTPSDNIEAKDLRALKMRNHVALSHEDQKQVQLLNNVALSHLRRRSLRDGRGGEHMFNLGVYADRGTVYYS